jgi:hypothetical protein
MTIGHNRTDFLKRTSELKDAIERYPDVSPFVIIKIDVKRKGVHYTESALSRLDPNIHQTRTLERDIFGVKHKIKENEEGPASLTMRDGTLICVESAPVESNPYFVEYLDGRLVLTYKGEVIEEVEFWEKPDFYNKKTSSGIPMNKILSSRPQRFDVNPYAYCHFWDNGHGCKYCDVSAKAIETKKKEGANFQIKLNPRDISETVKEGLKEKGRFTTFCITAGSNPHGSEPFDDEVDYYIEVLQAIGENFTTKKFPSQLISSSFNERQLRRLYDETGIMGYTSDLEVLNKNLFDWICPGKAEWVGFDNWKKNLYTAVDIFGRGFVNSGFVGGVETAKPLGFKSEDEALKNTLEGVAEFAEHGVTTVFCIWSPGPDSFFKDQTIPSLDYFVRLSKGIDDITQEYGLTNDTDDFRRCGNHPNSDLLRLRKKVPTVV